MKVELNRKEILFIKEIIKFELENLTSNSEDDIKNILFLNKLQKKLNKKYE